jgi:hypothetical protein
MEEEQQLWLWVAFWCPFLFFSSSLTLSVGPSAYYLPYLPTYLPTATKHPPTYNVHIMHASCLEASLLGVSPFPLWMSAGDSAVMRGWFGWLYLWNRVTTYLPDSAGLVDVSCLDCLD